MTNLTPDYLSPEYTAAMKTHDQACRIYAGVLEEYRAGTMDDDVFLTARATMDTATETFDVAFAAEASRREDEAETPAADDQFGLGL